MNLLQGADVRPTTVQTTAIAKCTNGGFRNDGAVDGDQDHRSADPQRDAEGGRFTGAHDHTRGDANYTTTSARVRSQRRVRGSRAPRRRGEGQAAAG